MSVYDLVLLVLVAGGAFYAGYQVGRLKVLAEQGGRPAADNGPLPGPNLDRPYAEADARSSLPRGAPPPASAGADRDSEARTWRTPPRRSSKPPPAAAGLMGTGSADGPGARQK